jgi:TPR repeat protein
MRYATNCVRWSLCAVIVFGTLAAHAAGQTKPKPPAKTTTAKPPSIAALETQADAFNLQKNYAAAFPLYLKAANLGSMKSEYDVGILYLRGLGVSLNLAQALDWFLKASAQGSSDANTCLNSLPYWTGVNALLASSFAANQTLAAQGDPTAEYVVGLFYWRGWGTPTNGSQASLWLQKAAAQGSAAAEYELGVMDMTADLGAGKPVNAPEGVKWITLAADQGLAAAQNELGQFYASGSYGITKDPAQSFSWYLKAAQQGDAIGEYNAGSMYQTGTGTTRNNAQALAWYQKSAAQANVQAELGIATVYIASAAPATSNFTLSMAWSQADAFWNQPNLHTAAANKNYAQAMVWFQKAAADGNGDADYEIGMMYWHGVGVQANLTVARDWMYRASQQYFSYGNGAYDQLTALLTPAAPPAPAPQQAAPQQGICAAVYIVAGEDSVYGTHMFYGAAWSRSSYADALAGAKSELLKVATANEVDPRELPDAGGQYAATPQTGSGCTYAHGAVAGKLKIAPSGSSIWNPGGAGGTSPLGPGIYDIIAANFADSTDAAVSAAMSQCQTTDGPGNNDAETCTVLQQW